MTRHESVGSGTVVLAFMAGAMAGAVLALLFAPAAGDETRQFLNDKAREGRERAAEAARHSREFLHRQKETVQSAIERGREAYEQARVAEPPQEPM